MDKHLKRYVHGHSIKIQKNNYTLESHPSWKGGRVLTINKYWSVKIPSHPNTDNQGYVREHRLVMEKQLGRYLTKHEVVHHLDGNTLNNNISNLKIVSASEHAKIHKTKDMSNRYCLLCNSKTTGIYNGNTPSWFKFSGGFICSNCKRKQYRHKKMFSKS